MSAALPPCGLTQHQLDRAGILPTKRCTAEYGSQRSDGTYAVCGEPYANHLSTTAAASSSSSASASAVDRPPRGGDPIDRRYPIFPFKLTNEINGRSNSESELLIDTGNLRCELLLPAHDAIKFGLRPSEATPTTATPIGGAPLRLLHMTPNLLVSVSLKTPDGQIRPKAANLDVAVIDTDWEKAIEEEKEKVEGSAAAPTSDSTDPSYESPPLQSRSTPAPIITVTPVKYMAGTSKGKAILGDMGMDKLDLHYDSRKKCISLLDHDF